MFGFLEKVYTKVAQVASLVFGFMPAIIEFKPHIAYSVEYICLALVPEFSLFTEISSCEASLAKPCIFVTRVSCSFKLVEKVGPNVLEANT